MEAFPELFATADRAAVQLQRRYYRIIQAGLTAGVIAAIGSAISVDLTPDLDLGGVISGVAFLAAAALTAYVYLRKPDQGWYENRAVAESIKSLSWQYAVRAGVFEHADSHLFGARVRRIVRTMSVAGLVVAGGNDQVTGWMEELRSRSLPDRRSTYLSRRVEDQSRYYSRAAAENRMRAQRWFGVAIVLHLIGVALAFLKATNRVDADLLGIAATAAAGALAWVQTRDCQNLAESYRVAANELAEVLGEGRALSLAPSPSLLSSPDEDWSRFVRNAEQTVSREHMLWLARREPSGLTPNNEEPGPT